MPEWMFTWTFFFWTLFFWILGWRLGYRSGKRVEQDLAWKDRRRR